MILPERTTLTTITFLRPFSLSDVDGVQPAGNYTVETIDKTIYLKGSVPTQEMKDAALNMAKTIANKGYTVSEDLKVEAKPSTPETRISDEQHVSK